MSLRSTWSGSITFGMVAVPVKAYKVVDEQELKLNNIHRPCGGRITMPKTCPTCDRKAEDAELVKGYEISKGKYILLEEVDIASLPVKSIKAIDVLEFVDPEQVRSEQMDTPYFLAPDKGGNKSYALLLAAMESANKVALGRVAMRNREHLCILRPHAEGLLMETLHWADEMRDMHDLEIVLPAVDPKELAMAGQLIAALEGTGDLAAYKDEYRVALEALIEAKAEGKAAPVAAEIVPAPSENIMAGLMASIEAAKAKKKPVATAKPAKARKAA